MPKKSFPAVQPYLDLSRSEKTRQAVQEALSVGYYRYATKHKEKAVNPYTTSADAK